MHKIKIQFKSSLPTQEEVLTIISVKNCKTIDL